MIHHSAFGFMSDLATRELWSIFDARRVKAPELTAYDSFFNGVTGFFKNRRPMLKRLRAQGDRVISYEQEIKDLGASRFREEVATVREQARLDRLQGAEFDRAVAIAREACWRGIGKRPYPVQIMGALAMYEGMV